MMYADLIDQEDLLGQLKSLGFQVPSGSTAQQACECAVRGLNDERAMTLRTMVKQMYTSSATILDTLQGFSPGLCPCVIRRPKVQLPMTRSGD